MSSNTDGGTLRAYLQALGGDTYDDGGDGAAAWSVPPVYVIRFAYDDPPEPTDDDEDWEGEDAYEPRCDDCGFPRSECLCSVSVVSDVVQSDAAIDNPDSGGVQNSVD